MKFYHNTLLILLAIVLLAGCATPKGDTIADKRDYVLDMKDATLARLYEETLLQKSRSRMQPDMVCSVTLAQICFS